MITRPFPELRDDAEVLASLGSAKKQTYRRAQANALADKIAGTRIDIVETESGHELVDTETGESLTSRAAAFAALLLLGSEPQNHIAGWFDSEADEYEGGTALWKPSLRLDPNWMETMRRRSRKVARVSMRRMMQLLPRIEKMRRAGYGDVKQKMTLKLLTLPMPRCSQSSILEIKRLNLALRSLMKSDWWRDRVWGGVKGVEDALDADGPHVHAHLLILSRYLDKSALDTLWQQYVDEATRRVYGYRMSDNVIGPFTDVRMVKKKVRAGHPEEMSTDDAINEVTKYVTKPADFLTPDANGNSIKQEVLLELCECERWPRMFELLGKARSAETGPSEIEKVALAAKAALLSIHRAYLSGRRVNLGEGVGWELVEGWDETVDGSEEMRQEVVKALKATCEKPKPKPRPPSWRQLLGKLDIGQWITIMVARVASGRKYRQRQIQEQNPNGVWVNGCGDVIYGVR